VSADWDLLRREAVAMTERAYAPYSGVLVGACGITDDGRLVRGCNVENASYGLTLCAECGLVSDLVATGGGRLAALSVVAGDGSPLAPCGRCRQLLLEAGGHIDRQLELVRRRAAELGKLEGELCETRKRVRRKLREQDPERSARPSPTPDPDPKERSAR